MQQLPLLVGEVPAIMSDGSLDENGDIYDSVGSVGSVGSIVKADFGCLLPFSK